MSLQLWMQLHLCVLHRPILGRRLIERFGSAEVIISHSRSQIPELSDAEWLALQGLRRRVDVRAAEQQIQRASALGIQILTWDMQQYPALLRELADPPLLLFARGNAACLHRERARLAVVGARKATRYGLSLTEHWCRELAAHNVQIVSGLAFGIDAAAHRACLDTQEDTIAVLASGLDDITPRRHYNLGRAVMQQGVLLSEYPIGCDAQPFHYPQRNRIISGLSHGVLVAECQVRSGSMWTARHAMEQGRLVMAIPGAVDHVQCAGPHELIRQGATLVASPEQICEVLQTQQYGHLESRPRQGPESDAMGLPAERVRTNIWQNLS